MRALKPLLMLAVLALAALLWGRHAPEPAPPANDAAVPHATGNARADTTGVALPSFLPPEAADTLSRIARGGPFEHRQDGVVFQNREGRLPSMPEGYYHEYTVETPGLDYRGARRIITGGNPPQAYYYTDDHYRTFRPFEVSR
ncbi:MAG TPA: ribonuclease domain-containing protein [Dyella sp.]|uniref:ribonuclease domain-containing protein n=1 Tax=Dyella sp. TaxID=1869338 RepID=UPI002D77D640|nr:ribonuclease domain-containing protein [Dyella sp.]HET6554581.1 ribonuclease domain-containing protein [Dyella sp.]